MRRATKAGFTLVEIMIVVAIIALLAAIAIPNVLRGRTTANESAAIGNMRALLSSLEMYRSVYQAYPAPDGTAFINSMYGLGGVPAGCAAGVSPDPDFGPPSFCRVLTNAVVQGYLYTFTGVNGLTYQLGAVPQSASTGSRSFVVTEAGLIYHCSGIVAPDPTLAGAATIDQAPKAACP
ncbi:MAG: prepilin-type N-terminal cleavage/methylation domain-containing protein [Candidatus Omnitrophica bacterium]|nr:prepilin-type N-terminal cleavage/methylation domain-containing protein [Candidatus Omnitrophota bacterium]